MKYRQQSKVSAAKHFPACKEEVCTLAFFFVLLFVFLLNPPAIAQTSMTNKFYYDHNDRLVGAEYSQGISVAYQYDGNGNLQRQTVLSRAPETNGLPVLWSFLNGLTNGTAADGPYGDPDGDGWNNYQEWLAGTDPNDPNSKPSLLGNPGTNIASLSLPFTPTNFVIGVGQLDGLGAEEMVIGADGNPGTNNNFLTLLTQGPTNWSAQQIDVGPFGITSIAVGQPTNRPTAGIYVGLRGTNGTGKIMEFTASAGIWQSNLVALSTNPATFVIGIRAGNDLLASISVTNGPDGTLWSLTWSNGGWNQRMASTNSGHATGITSQFLTQQLDRSVGIRLLDGAGIEVFNCGLQLVANGSLIPTNSRYNPATDKWYFTTPSKGQWNTAQNYCTQLGGNLVAIASDAENQWVQQQFTGSYFLGLNYGGSIPGFGGPVDPIIGWGWIDGNLSTYRNWASSQPNYWGVQFVDPIAAAKDGTGHWYMTDGFWGPGGAIPGIGELRGWDWVTVLPNPSGIQQIRWPGSELTAVTLPTNSINSISIYRAFVDDKNSSGRVDQGDEFDILVYGLQATSWTTNVLESEPIALTSPAQSYAITPADFLLDQPTCLFSAEPDGQVFIWTTPNGINAARQLFSADYTGKAWHALKGVRMAELGQGLAGILVNPTNQNACNIIFWPPQAVLSAPLPNAVETAPIATVVPSPNPLGAMAAVTVRLSDAEGNTSVPFLQYQFLGSSNWQNATLLSLDGAPYGPASRVSAFPAGVNHILAWNALADLGFVSTNIFLRASAADFMLLGQWSAPVPFQVSTLPPLQINSGSTNLQMTTNGFQIQISGLTGAGPLIIYASTNLMDWIPIFTNPPATGTIQFIDPAAANLPRRFYRADEQ